MNNNINNKTIRIDKKFSVSMVVIATIAILAIGSTATNITMAQLNLTKQLLCQSEQHLLERMNANATEVSGNKSATMFIGHLVPIAKWHIPFDDYNKMCANVTMNIQPNIQVKGN